MLERVLIRGPRINEIGSNVDFRKLVSQGLLVLASLDPNSLCYKRRASG